MWFQHLMKLRFLMSYCTKNSVRDKVIGKKWIYLERKHFTDGMWAISEVQEWPQTVVWLVFMGWVIS